MMESLTNDIVEKARIVIDEVGTTLLHTQAWGFILFILSYFGIKIGSRGLYYSSVIYIPQEIDRYGCNSNSSNLHFLTAE